jgi:hypothetical protein
MTLKKCPESRLGRVRLYILAHFSRMWTPKKIHRENFLQEFSIDVESLSFKSSIADPDPDPPYPRVFGPPGSGSGSISHGYGSGSGSGSFYH